MIKGVSKKKSFQYFNDEQLQTRRGDEMELDEDKSEERGEYPHPGEDTFLHPPPGSRAT